MKKIIDESSAGMIQEILDMGITHEELAVEIPCSRMTVYNWLNGTHAPTEANIKSIKAAHKKFQRLGLLNHDPSGMAVELITSHGMTPERIAKEVGCSVNSVKSWLAGEVEPRGIYRLNLRSLYSDMNVAK